MLLGVFYFAKIGGYGPDQYTMGPLRLGKLGLSKMKTPQKIWYDKDFLQKMQYLWVNQRIYRIMSSKCIFSWEFEFCYNSRQEGDRPLRLRPPRPPSESLVSHFSS